MSKEKKDDRAKDQARAQLESVREYVQRLKHARGECDYNIQGCELEEIKMVGAPDLYNFKANDNYKDNEELREQYHDDDKAREVIEEDPLSVQVRSDWHNPGEGNDKPQEYMILLCTGGPAVRIIGDLSQYGQPETAQLEFQDWFTPWEEYPLSSEEEDDVIEYARVFYFGE